MNSTEKTCLSAKNSTREATLAGEKGRDVIFKIEIKDGKAEAMGSLRDLPAYASKNVRYYKNRLAKVKQVLEQSKIPFVKVVYYEVSDPCDAYPDRTAVLYDCVTPDGKTLATLFVPEEVIEYFNRELREPLQDFAYCLK